MSVPRAVLLVVLLGSLLAACGDDDAADEVTTSTVDPTPTVTAADQSLAGPQWDLVLIVDSDAGPGPGLSSLPEGVEAWMQFGEDGRVEVHPGCNTGSATYEVDGDTITFGDLALTRMACPGAPMEVESMVTGLLQGPLTFEIGGDELRLRGGDGGLDFRAAS